MPILATAPPPAKQSPTRFIAPAPASLAGELALRAVARFEEALAFRERVAGFARLGAGPLWAKLAAQSRRDLDECEEALAFTIEGVLDLLALPGDAEGVEVRPRAAGPVRVLDRGFEVAGVAYLLTDDVGNMRPGIIARVES